MTMPWYHHLQYKESMESRGGGKLSVEPEAMHRQLELLRMLGLRLGLLSLLGRGNLATALGGRGVGRDDVLHPRESTIY